MIVSRETLLQHAGTSGFRPEILEKVFYLLQVLSNIRRHPNLKDKIALKGGTALNLFEFNVPRLSVDLDLNYIGAADLETMKLERPRVEQALNDVCGQSELTVEHRTTEHAGGKWKLRYLSALGGGGNLEIDINFMLRVPLWPVVSRDSKEIGTFQAFQIPVLDIHELAAGKLAALLARHTARDLFDAHQLLTQVLLDNVKLRLAFVVYGGMNIEDWRNVSIDNIAFDSKELRQNLIPVLRNDVVARFGNESDWAERLVQETKVGLKAVLPLFDREKAFLNELLERAEIHPEHLTDDPTMTQRITSQPMLQWKALNVRKFKGL
jgi:predicted nucleotidyltransferase component of viral defense system